MSVIRLKFVQAFRDVRGKRRHYYRRGGQRVPLPGLPGSEEFMAAYAAAVARSSPVEIGAGRTMPGTIAALVAAYYGSAKFKHEIKDNTRRTRRAVLERFREQYGDRPAAPLDAEGVRRVLAKIEKPHARANWLKGIRALMEFAIDVGLRRDDPTLGIKVKTPKTDGFKSWEEDDIAAFRAKHPIGTRARLALELLLGTGQRLGDVIRMGHQHIRAGVVHVRQNKTGAVLNIPVGSDLAAALAGTPREHLTFLTTEKGEPFTAGGFGGWFRTVCDEAGLTGLSAHGLRKATCRRLAEAGCTEKEIASISGHASLNEVARYTKAASQTLLAAAAMGKLQPPTAIRRTNRDRRA